MTDPSHRPPTSRTNRGAVAGSLILGAIVGCAAVGFGVGAIVGAAVPLGLVGLFAGVFVGIALVIARFRDL